MIARWVALRIIQEMRRDRRTVAFFVLVPIAIMTLIYYAMLGDETARLGVVTRGLARMYDATLIRSLEETEDLVIVPLDIPDDLTDPAAIEQAIHKALGEGQAEGVLYMDEQLIVDRFAGRRGNLHVYVQGERPTLNAIILGGIAESMDDLANDMGVVIDASCSAFCANSVNIKPMELKKHYVYGSEDYRSVDYFLPVIPPFIIFFLTFIISAITFQRERVRGTLDRLMVAPMGFSQVVLGYIGGFFFFSVLQTVIVVGYVLALLSFPVSWGQIGAILFMALLMMLVALMMGLLASFLAHNEFQAVQFIPLVILPQVFLSDMIWDIRSFPAVLRGISWVLPMTHANQAMRGMILRDMRLWEAWPQILILTGFFLVTLFILMYAGRLHARRRS
ncbi:MAG: ABC transporter permease [Deltaproteobacteria bacterium]|nr:ABC transporter permease [Deltaproteobacteria bacterium]